jgi:hypothetical protein
MNDESVFCSTCGQSQATTQESFNAAPAAKESYVGWTVLGFLIPLVGLILWAVWKDSEPDKALAVGKGGLMMLCFSYPIVGLIVYLVMKENYPDIAKACGICAIISVGASVVFGVLFGVIYAILMASLMSTAAIVPILLI